MTTAAAQFNLDEVITIPAGSDLSTKQYYFMDISAGKLAVAGAGTRVAGVLQDKPSATDKPGALKYGGVALVYASGSISSGGGVASDASGKAVAATGSAYVAGIALTDASADEYVAVLLTGASAVGLAADSEAISSSGALNPDVPTSLLTVSGTKAYTLADGAHIGQRKTIECVSAASTPLGTVTIATASSSEPTTHTFTAVGQKLVLEWRSDGWKMLTKIRAGTQVAVIGTTVLTGLDMALLYDAQVTATVDSTGTKGLPSGTLPGERVYVGCSVAASTPVGSLDGTYETLGGAAATHLQAIGATTDTVTLEWTGAKWLVVANSGITVA